MWVFFVLSVSTTFRSYPKVIYRNDSRIEFYQASLREQSFIRNTSVALLKSWALGVKNEKGFYTQPYQGKTLQETDSVCKEVNYSQQPVAAFCSGTLIGVDRVLTAGHCVSECDIDDRYVFDFNLLDEEGHVQAISDDDVYFCRNVFMNGRPLDYAVVQLDRPVRGRMPAQVYTSGAAAVREIVSMFGYPSGLPLKLDPNGVVSVPHEVRDGYFQVIIDSFAGNSGSGIFNIEQQVIGILVRGSGDYEQKGDCVVPRVIECNTPDCSQRVAGESATYASIAIAAAPACTVDSDCEFSAIGTLCNRQCIDGYICCTGWCGNTSIAANFNDSECASYLNVPLTNQPLGPYSPQKKQKGPSSRTIYMIAGICAAVFVLCCLGCVCYQVRATSRTLQRRKKATLEMGEFVEAEASTPTPQPQSRVTTRV